LAVRRVIIVDDSAALCSHLSKAIGAIDPDIETETASDGIEALKRFQDSAYDLIVTDLNMPVMGGLRFITKVRSIPKYHLTPILVISGSASAEEQAIALDIGATAYLPKPLKVSEVVSTVTALLEGKPMPVTEPVPSVPARAPSRTPARAPGAKSKPPEPKAAEAKATAAKTPASAKTPPVKAAPAKPVPPPRKIVVCDDDVVLLRLMYSYLRQQFNAEVRIVNNGEDALKAVETDRPDLLVLDFMMPKMNGDRVLDILKARQPAVSRRTRVLVYSAINMKAEVMKKGADAFLQKPATVTQIQQAVARLLEAGAPDRGAGFRQ